ncbi:MAG: hypothetical protein U9Q68_00750 [Euryarchaeota archaeon]|nr:hypothetical protein [Euryarchaeota archaeon]
MPKRKLIAKVEINDDAGGSIEYLELEIIARDSCRQAATLGSYAVFAGIFLSGKHRDATVRPTNYLNLWRHFEVGFCKFKSVPMNDYITK